MATGGIYSIGGSFWEFGEPDWEHTKYLMMFGVAEDHDSNPIKTGLGNQGEWREVRFRQSGTNGLFRDLRRVGGHRAGFDGLFALAIVHELLKAGKVDLPYLALHQCTMVGDPESGRCRRWYVRARR